MAIYFEALSNMQLKFIFKLLSGFLLLALATSEADLRGDIFLPSVVFLCALLFGIWFNSTDVIHRLQESETYLFARPQRLKVSIGDEPAANISEPEVVSLSDSDRSESETGPESPVGESERVKDNLFEEKCEETGELFLSFPFLSFPSPLNSNTFQIFPTERPF